MQIQPSSINQNGARKHATSGTDFPTRSEYQKALANPGKCFVDPELQGCTIECTSKSKALRVHRGSESTVFKATTPSGRVLALRCLHSEASDRKARYDALNAHLKKSALAYCANASYEADALSANGRIYPFVKMDWVGGVTLEHRVQELLGQQDQLEELAIRICTMNHELEKAGVAHGNLSAKHIRVDGENLRLIDYDSIVVPGLESLATTRPFDAAFQHPARIATESGVTIDRSAILVIVSSILALSEDPSLWNRFHRPGRLLFGPSDLRSPDASEVFDYLMRLPGEASRLATQLRNSLVMEPPTALSEIPAWWASKTKASNIDPDQTEIDEEVPPPSPLFKLLSNTTAPPSDSTTSGASASTTQSASNPQTSSNSSDGGSFSAQPTTSDSGFRLGTTTVNPNPNAPWWEPALVHHHGGPTTGVTYEYHTPWDQPVLAARPLSRDTLENLEQEVAWARFQGRRPSRPNAGTTFRRNARPESLLPAARPWGGQRRTSRPPPTPRARFPFGNTDESASVLCGSKVCCRATCTMGLAPGKSAPWNTTRGAPNSVRVKKNSRNALPIKVLTFDVRLPDEEPQTAANNFEGPELLLLIGSCELSTAEIVQISSLRETGAALRSAFSF